MIYKQKTQWLTKILPVVDCPDISSPAQSLASVIKPISATSLLLPATLLSGTLVLMTAWVSPDFFRQQMKANTRHNKMMNRPTKKVIMLESKKHHHLRSLRHSASLNKLPFSTSPILSKEIVSTSKKCYFTVIVYSTDI